MNDTTDSSGFFGPNDLPEAVVDIFDGNRFTDIEQVHVALRGYTTIHRARRRGKRFALKSLSSDSGSSPQKLQLLRKEFLIGYHLNHPAIVETLSYETIDSVGEAIVMEWIDGVTLSEALSEGLINDTNVVAIVSAIADAIDYLHSKQVFHRDIKPSNILLTRDTLSPKIIDFGFSDTADFEILKESAGTAAFAAPEQLHGDEIDSRADNYAFGLILREIAPAAPTHRRRFLKLANQCCAPDPDRRPRRLSDLRFEPKSPVKAAAWIAAILAVCATAFVTYTLSRDYTLRNIQPAPPVHDTLYIETVPPVDTARINFLNEMPDVIKEITARNFRLMFRLIEQGKGQSPYDLSGTNKDYDDAVKRINKEVDAYVAKNIAPDDIEYPFILNQIHNTLQTSINEFVLGEEYRSATLRVVDNVYKRYFLPDETTDTVSVN